MSKIYFEVEGGVVVKNTPMPEIGENTYKTEVVMTKEVFQKCYKMWIEHQGNEQEPCDFCKDIYPDNDTNDILFKKGKYSDFNKDSFITIDDEGKYWINIDPGDPYELGYLGNIKFCPYCGRKLEERSEE